MPAEPKRQFLCVLNLIGPPLQNEISKDSSAGVSGDQGGDIRGIVWHSVWGLSKQSSCKEVGVLKAEETQRGDEGLWKQADRHSNISLSLV